MGTTNTICEKIPSVNVCAVTYNDFYVRLGFYHIDPDSGQKVETDITGTIFKAKLGQYVFTMSDGLEIVAPNFLDFRKSHDQMKYGGANTGNVIQEIDDI